MDNKNIEELSNEELNLLIEQLKLDNEKLKYEAYEKCEIIENMLDKIENQNENN